MVNLTELRRALHTNPELAFKETVTAELLQRELTAAGFNVSPGIATTGLVADRGTGTKVALRSDMDALPINELNNVAYRSKISGVMHACGHDAHMACVIGAARLLSESGDEAIRIIMQPGEEISELNERGSLQMISAGVLDDVKAILGLHVDATMPAGRVGVITQPTHTSVGQFKLSYHTDDEDDFMQRSIKLLGRVRDVSSEVKLQKGVIGISEFRMRNSESFRGLQMDGTIDYPAADVAAKAVDLLQTAANDVFGANNFEFSSSLNDELLAKHEAAIETLYQSACAVVGEENVVRVTRRTWAGNFGDFTQHTPGAFLLLGAEMRGDRRIQHTATFDIDEDALPIGAQVLAHAARALHAL